MGGIDEAPGVCSGVVQGRRRPKTASCRSAQVDCSSSTVSGPRAGTPSMRGSSAWAHKSRRLPSLATNTWKEQSLPSMDTHPRIKQNCQIERLHDAASGASTKTRRHHASSSITMCHHTRNMGGSTSSSGQDESECVGVARDSRPWSPHHTTLTLTHSPHRPPTDTATCSVHRRKHSITKHIHRGNNRVPRHLQRTAPPNVH